MLRALAVYTEMLGQPVLCGVLKSIGDPAAAPARRRSTFEYVRSWLEHRDAYPIEPLRLPLARGPYPSPDGEQVQGIFRDAVPDSWGQRVIEKTFPRYRFGMMEYLAATDASRSGDLSFGIDANGPGCFLPDGSPIAWAHVETDLAEMMQVAAMIEASEPVPEHLRRLLRPVQSLGGARPKASFRDERGFLWVAKFPSQEDVFNMAGAEAACLDMAVECGIAVPERKVLSIGGAPVLLVRRFDRAYEDGKELRLGYMSGETALGAIQSTFYTRLTYADLAAEARRLGDLVGAKELFRRMLFDIAVGNSDNHLRNHAFIRNLDGRWTLSPVFDVTPVGRPGASMVLRISAENADFDLGAAVSRAGAFGIAQVEAEAIRDKILTVSRQWPSFMIKRGVKQSELAMIAPALYVERAPRAVQPDSSFDFG